MTPRPWRPGDPVGCGEAFLPTRALQLAYADACRAAILDATARAIAEIPDLATRRARIAAHPEAQRGALQERIAQIWQQRK